MLSLNPIFYLVTLGIIGIFIRILYFPFEIPFSYDTLDYFAYSLVESQIGKFPEGVNLVNNGWPTIVSFFFYISNTDNFMHLTYIQRGLSILFSVLTIIPIYFLARRFFTKKIALIAPSLFILEPNILMNSIQGGTVPIFIFLGTMIIYLFLSKNFRSLYPAFALIAILSFIRYEGLLLIFPLSVMFFLRFKKNHHEIKNFIFIIFIFALILSVIGILRYEAYGQDGLISSITAGGKYVIEDLSTGDEKDEPWMILGQSNHLNFIQTGTNSMIKFIGITMLPIFIFFIPISIIFLVKDRSFLYIDTRIISIICYAIIFLIPAFYAYGRHIEDIRYLFILYPIFSLISLHFIKKIFQYNQNHNLILIAITGGIIISSVSFLEYDKNDYIHERDAFAVAKKIVNEEFGYNIFSPESKYIKSAEVYNEWPPEISFVNGHVERKANGIVVKNHDTLEEFLIYGEKQGLTHLIVDEKKKNSILDNIFYNEEKFPYLQKIYDSSEEKLNYKVKIFEIDYNYFYEYMK